MVYNQKPLYLELKWYPRGIILKFLRWKFTFRWVQPGGIKKITLETEKLP
jgi:hypothetical protein